MGPLTAIFIYSQQIMVCLSTLSMREKFQTEILR
uniref:Uncharacterized protein n=1 Tax=Anguilla anguilla TaxID=7936 RepID=A0A0E9WPF0_ANGAN